MRYWDIKQQQEHWVMCQELLPAACLDCQMYKLADGLLSGRYSHPAPVSRNHDPLLHESPTPVFQNGIRPATFKVLIGKGHAEFATMRQQDSEEFLTYLLTFLRRNTKKTASASPEPTQVFSFGTEQRLQCGECKRVRYMVDPTDVVSVAVPAKEAGKDDEGKVKWEEIKVMDCLDALTAVEALQYHCPACAKDVIATKYGFLCQVHLIGEFNRLCIGNLSFPLSLKCSLSTRRNSSLSTGCPRSWVGWMIFLLQFTLMSNSDIPLILPPQDELVLDKYIGHGHQPGEAELTNDTRMLPIVLMKLHLALLLLATAPKLPHFNEAALALLQGMGFPLIRCQKALLATGNNDAEAAMEWLFVHMDDPGSVMFSFLVA
jgi:ubiquitin carboxyl-terminal hydrolase 5/13